MYGADRSNQRYTNVGSAYGTGKRAGGFGTRQSNYRRLLGTGVVGGMVVGTLALLFVVPVFYIIFEFLQEKIRKPMEEEADVQVLLEKEKSEVERERN